MDNNIGSVERYKKLYDTIIDERMASFFMFQQTLGGCILSGWQPEIDLEINDRIKAIIRERDMLMEALKPFAHSISPTLHQDAVVNLPVRAKDIRAVNNVIKYNVAKISAKVP